MLALNVCMLTGVQGVVPAPEPPVPEPPVPEPPVPEPPEPVPPLPDAATNAFVNAVAKSAADGPVGNLIADATAVAMSADVNGVVAPGCVDVAIEFTAPADGDYFFDLAGSDYDTVLSIFDITSAVVAVL